LTDAGQETDATSGTQPAEPAEPTEPTEPAERAERADSGEPSQEPVGLPADIIISRTPTGLMIASDDPEALDELEHLLNTLSASGTSSAGPQFTVFYLRYAKAEVVSQLLNQVISGQTSSDGLLPGLGGGGGLLDTLLGAGAGALAGGNVRINPDARLNLLIVQGNYADVVLVNDLLRVVDQPYGPEPLELMAPPRLIPVVNGDVQQIAEVVRQIYAPRIVGGQQANRQPSPEDFIRAIRGGGGGGRGGRGGGGGQNAQDQLRDVTVSVDTQSRSLVVSAPDPIFQQIQELVAQLDDAGRGGGEVFEVVSLNRANPQVVQQTIAALMDQPQTANRNRTNNNQQFNRAGGGGQNPNAAGQFQTFDAFRAFGGGGFGGGGRGGGASAAAASAAGASTAAAATLASAAVAAVALAAAEEAVAAAAAVAAVAVEAATAAAAETGSRLEAGGWRLEAGGWSSF
jgi:hypothetical protein